MRLPTLILLLAVVGSSFAFWHGGQWRADDTEPDAIEIAHNFMKKFMKAIKSDDLFQVLPLISPQAGTTNIDASKLIQELKGYRVSFRSARFISKPNEVFVSAVFRPPKTEKAAKEADFVLQRDSSTKEWSIKSMTDIKTHPHVQSSGNRRDFYPIWINLG